MTDTTTWLAEDSKGIRKKVFLKSKLNYTKLLDYQKSKGLTLLWKVR